MVGDHAGSATSLGRIWCSIVVVAGVVGAAPATCRAAAAVSWGGNRLAELGAGYRDTYEESPVRVVGLNNITAIAAGSGFDLALLSDGTVRAWGGNLWGELGDGTHVDTWGKATNVVEVAELTGVKAISAANSHSLALLEDGTVKTWGNNNYGQLGNGKGGTERSTGEKQTTPKAVQGLVGVIAIASGGGSNYALLSNHTVMAWGQNEDGQLGIGETGPETCVNELKMEVPCSTRPRPVLAPVKNAKGEAEMRPLVGVTAISAGAQAAYALLEDHSVMSWGTNDKGQLGTGGEPLHINLTPEEVKNASSGEPLRKVVAVSGNTFDALALLETGQVLGWGAVGKGELGEVEQPEECKRVSCVKTARPVAGLERLKATAVAAGEGYSLVVSGGRVYSFGRNAHGQLGDGSSTASAVPTAVQGVGPVSAVAAGSAHVLALLQPGVEPPPPLVTLEPGVRSLKLAWTLQANEYKVQYSARDLKQSARCTEPGAPEGCEALEEGRKWSAIFRLGEKIHSIEFTGLEAQPYVLVIKSIDEHHLERKRVLVGTPLP
jgi:alpha-tubulin suppressor-like RCC1 family protein